MTFDKLPCLLAAGLHLSTVLLDCQACSGSRVLQTFVAQPSDRPLTLSQGFPLATDARAQQARRPASSQ